MAEKKLKTLPKIMKKQHEITRGHINSNVLQTLVAIYFRESLCLLFGFDGNVRILPKS